MKVLICASSLTHIHNFHVPYLRFFRQHGVEVHLAIPGSEQPPHTDRLHSVPITKNFFSVKNLIAVQRLRRILKNNRFDLILTHTALASLVVRLAVRTSGRVKTKVICTVHGYLFFNGCCRLKELLYKTPERCLRGVTDCIVTMNDEDYATAQRMVKKGGRVYQVPGMGVDAERFTPATDTEKAEARQDFSVPATAYVLVYPAEFSKRKNHRELIAAFAAVKEKIPEAVLLLCGEGALKKKTEAEVRRRKLGDSVRFLGWRGDMERVYRACDMAVSSSISEGLPFNIIEAQLCGLPVAASRIRGHTDLIRDGVTGELYTPGKPDELAGMIRDILLSPDRGRGYGIAGREKAKAFSIDVAYQCNTAIYMEYLNQ